MTEVATCWCGRQIRLTSLGVWGHCDLGGFGHAASPTKPIRRLRKAKEA